MAEQRKNFALRLSPELYAALERWAADDLVEPLIQGRRPMDDGARDVRCQMLMR